MSFSPRVKTTRENPKGHEKVMYHDLFSKEVMDFWLQWYCGKLGSRVYELGVGREFGNPKRLFVSPDDAASFIPNFILGNRERKRPSFMSVNYFEGRDKLAYVEKIFIDIDAEDLGHAKEEALKVVDILSSFCRPFVVFSGSKGYHIYCWLSSLIKVSNAELLKEAINTFLRRVGVLEQGIDTNVLELKRLSRIPYSWHQKSGNLVTVVDEADLRPIEAGAFNLDQYMNSALDVGVIKEIYEELKYARVLDAIKRDHLRQYSRRTYSYGSAKRLPEAIEELGSHEAVPPCIRQLISKFVADGRVAEDGGREHSARLAILWYLMWLGYDKEAIINFFRHAEDFREEKTRAQVEFAFKKLESGNPYCPYSCRSMREFGFCVNCGWDRSHRNPLTYSIVRGIVPSELRKLFFEVVGRKEAVSSTPRNTQSGTEANSKGMSSAQPKKTLESDGSRNGVSSGGVSSYVSWVKEFVEKTGLREFSYDDFKRWLEVKLGRLLNASEWQGWERRLRQLVVEGYLGRKYLVNGVWVDYGSAEVSAPPSRTVRFYVKF